MRALPPSCSSSVESRRTSVDLPEPFWPRIATHSPRSIVNADVVEGGHAAPALAEAGAVLADEVLAQIDDFDGGVQLVAGRHQGAIVPSLETRSRTLVARPVETAARNDLSAPHAQEEPSAAPVRELRPRRASNITAFDGSGTRGRLCRDPDRSRDSSATVAGPNSKRGSCSRSFDETSTGGAATADRDASRCAVRSPLRSRERRVHCCTRSARAALRADLADDARGRSTRSAADNEIT